MRRIARALKVDIDTLVRAAGNTDSREQALRSIHADLAALPSELVAHVAAIVRALARAPSATKRRW